VRFIIYAGTVQTVYRDAGIMARAMARSRAAEKSPAAQAHRIPALDGWRLVAVTLVILTHLVEYSTLRTRIPAGLGFLGSFSGLGVQIFFVISGYVICTLLRQEHAENKRVSIFAFYVRRAFRILPPLWLYLATLLVLARSGVIDMPASDALNSALFVCNIQDFDCGWYVQHTWSLAFEEQFYLVFPFVLIALGLRLRALFSMATFVLVPFLVAIATLSQAGQAVFLLSNFQFLLAGAVFALYDEEIGDFLKRRARHPVILLGAIAALFLLYGFAANALAANLKTILAAPLIALILLHTARITSPVRTLLSLGPVRYGGRISYSLYLWQQVALAPYPNAGPAFYAATLAAAVLISVLSFHFLEQPLIGVGAQISRALKSRGTARKPPRLRARRTA
jgi:peptidoglycan/LPS O-acetylase OafA/YrhL